jgi:alpha-galactosidase
LLIGFETFERFIQADLGWERYNIPTYFEENERFRHGLKWLAGKLATMGFKLGVWKGFTSVSENHTIAREHSDWLVSDEPGKPKAGGKWFWEPHDRMFALDVTHPEVQEWI